jgi:hypothetical protein
MNKETVFIPFSGNSTFGFGIVRDVNDNDKINYKKCFENKTGQIFFNNCNDRQVKGIQYMIAMSGFNIKCTDIS